MVLMGVLVGSVAFWIFWSCKVCIFEMLKFDVNLSATGDVFGEICNRSFFPFVLCLGKTRGKGKNDMSLGEGEKGISREKRFEIRF